VGQKETKIQLGIRDCKLVIKR